MDSQRLIINNYDLSTTSLTTTTTQTGFTVVKAPKGPITPVLISANSAQGATRQMKEIFGDWGSSEDNKELYEVTQFISGGYDCYVSAPYTPGSGSGAAVTGTQIPVAYLTDEGVLEGLYRVPYTQNVEKLINGTEEPTINGITDFAGDYETPSVLYNMNYVKTYLDKGTDNPGAFPRFNNNKLTIETKITGTDWAGSFSSADFIIRKAFQSNGSFVDVTCYLQDNSVYEDVSHTILIGSVDTTTGVISIEGSDSASVITKTAVQALSSEEKRKVISTFWILSIQSTIKATIFPKYPSARITDISFRDFSTGGRDATKASTRNELVLTAYDTGNGAYGNTGTISSCTVHLDTQATDEEYKNQNIVAVYVRQAFSGDSYRSIAGYPSITLPAGVRNLEIDSGNIHDAGWSAAEEDEYSDVDIFFDSEVHDGPTDAFLALAAIHTLSGFVYNQTVAPGAINEASPNNYGSSYWNICNLAKVVDAKKGSIWSPMTGSYAKMLCTIIKNRWGGVAPMYLNSAGMGGQLQGMENVTALKYNYKKDAQMKLDAKNFNPVIKDSTYGVMVVGQKTSKSGAVTDWSYIGHVSAFLNFEKEIKNNVMIPQLGKANNDYYRALRAQQVEAYLAKRLQGSTRIWAAASVDTSTADGCNDAAARKARKFVINVKVKVDIFSEYVELNFVNVDQDMTV